MSFSEPFSGRPNVRKYLLAVYFQWRNMLWRLSWKERRYRSGPVREQIVALFFRRRNTRWNLSQGGRRHRVSPVRFPPFAAGHGRLSACGECSRNQEGLDTVLPHELQVSWGRPGRERKEHRQQGGMDCR